MPHLLGRYPAEFADAFVVQGTMSSTQELSKTERADLLGSIAIRKQAGKVLPLAVSWRHAPEEAPECFTASRRRQPCWNEDDRHHRYQKWLDRDEGHQHGHDSNGSADQARQTEDEVQRLRSTEPATAEVGNARIRVSKPTFTYLPHGLHRLQPMQTV
jgi:hypothetical protein